MMINESKHVTGCGLQLTLRTAMIFFCQANDILKNIKKIARLSHTCVSNENRLVRKSPPSVRQKLLRFARKKIEILRRNAGFL